METVTNRDLLEKFKESYPELEVESAKPLDISLLKKRMGITINLKSGDVLLYFPTKDC